MAFRIILSLSALSLSACGKAEISTSNMIGGAKFDNLKASWDKAFKIGGHPTKFSCTYNFKANRRALQTASLSGSAKSSGVKVGYDLSHSFASGAQTLKLSAAAKGALVKATLTKSVAKLTEIAGSYTVQKISMRPSYKPSGDVVELKVSSGDLGATVAYSIATSESSLSLEASHTLSGGQEVSAELTMDGVELVYSDDSFEKGAIWTASAEAPYSARTLGDATVVLRRAVSF